jgi:tricorn protease-like protein
MRTTGPAKLIFKNWPWMALGGSCTPGFWSPDGKKIAIMQVEEGEIWIASPEGGEPRQLTGGSGSTGWPFWSPDGKMIAFYLSGPTGTSLQVIPPQAVKRKR